MRLFEMRPAEDGAIVPIPTDRIVLVVAESEEMACEAVRTALAPPAPTDPRLGSMTFADLGDHLGPEEPGSVFVNGYRIAC
jgi:hypothetical protein